MNKESTILQGGFVPQKEKISSFYGKWQLKEKACADILFLNIEGYLNNLKNNSDFLRKILNRLRKSQNYN